VNVRGRCHLFTINNRHKLPTVAHHLQTSCGCLCTHAVEDGIDAFGMSCMDGVDKICLCIINEFGGPWLLKVRMVVAPRGDNDVCSNARS
jgi:hypothetical protein